MTSVGLILPFALSAILTIGLMGYWIRKVCAIGLVWDDMNKVGKIKLAGSGGIIVLFAFCVSSLSYVAFRVFALGEHNGILVAVFSLLLTTLFMGFIGFIDDLFGGRGEGF